MKKSQILVAGAVAVGSLGFAMPAMAGVSGNIGVSSEYVFRGVPFGGPQVSGGLDYESGNVSVGMWVSSVTGGQPSNELDVYGSISFGAISVGATGYIFPASPEGNQHFNAFEPFVSVSAGALSAALYYNTGFDGAPDDEFIYVDVSAELPVSDKASFGIHVGYTELSGDFWDRQAPGGLDGFLDVALTLSMGDFYVAVTAVEDSNGLPAFAGAGSNNAFERPRVNVGYSWSFDDVL